MVPVCGVGEAAKQIALQNLRYAPAEARATARWGLQRTSCAGKVLEPRQKESKFRLLYQLIRLEVQGTSRFLLAVNRATPHLLSFAVCILVS